MAVCIFSIPSITPQRNYTRRQPHERTWRACTCISTGVCTCVIDKQAAHCFASPAERLLPWYRRAHVRVFERVCPSDKHYNWIRTVYHLKFVDMLEYPYLLTHKRECFSRQGLCGEHFVPKVPTWASFTATHGHTPFHLAPFPWSGNIDASTPQSVHHVQRARFILFTTEHAYNAITIITQCQGGLQALEQR